MPSAELLVANERERRWWGFDFPKTWNARRDKVVEKISKCIVE